MGLGGEGHQSWGDWQPMPEPPLMWINSSVLLLSSVAWEIARLGSSHGRP
jgi:cytochrome c oxidase subunit III